MGNFDELVTSQDVASSAARDRQASKEAAMLEENTATIHGFLEAMRKAGNPGMREVPVIETTWTKHWPSKDKLSSRTVQTMSGWELGSDYAALVDGRLLHLPRDASGYLLHYWSLLPSINSRDLNSLLNEGQRYFAQYDPRKFATYLAEIFRGARGEV